MFSRIKDQPVFAFAGLTILGLVTLPYLLSLNPLHLLITIVQFLSSLVFGFALATIITIITKVSKIDPADHINLIVLITGVGGAFFVLVNFQLIPPASFVYAKYLNYLSSNPDSWFQSLLSLAISLLLGSAGGYVSFVGFTWSHELLNKLNKS